MTLLDTRKAAEFLTIKKQTLDLWRSKGTGPSFLKLGRAVRYRQSDLERFLEDRERTSTSDTGDGADA